jgi:hypothetical protein
MTLPEQPAKTTLFAGGKEPGLRANLFAPIKLVNSDDVEDEEQSCTEKRGTQQHAHG